MLEQHERIAALRRERPDYGGGVLVGRDLIRHDQYIVGMLAAVLGEEGVEILLQATPA